VIRQIEGNAMRTVHNRLTAARTAGVWVAALLGLCLPALATSYQVTFNLTAPLQNVFVYGDEFNGHVYAWDLFPARLGSVPVGTTTFALGSHNLVAWSVIATSGTAGVATGINDSLPALPTNQPFETVFPGYPQSVVYGNIAALNPGGAYNVQPAYYLFDFALTNEDTLKTDFPTGSLHMFVFSNGVNVGTATFSIAVDSACCAPDGSCTMTSQAACNGTWTSGAVCVPNPCPQPTGACCTGAHCSVGTQAACAGIYQGDGSACGPAGNPTTCCMANFDGVNGIAVQDIFAFLGAWFAQAGQTGPGLSADCNHDSIVNVSDIFAYLGAWFAGCA
jgi:hypothetical protein